MNTENVSL